MVNRTKGIVGLFRSSYLGQFQSSLIGISAAQYNSKHQTQISNGSIQQKPWGSAESALVKGARRKSYATCKTSNDRNGLYLVAFSKSPLECPRHHRIQPRLLFSLYNLKTMLFIEHGELICCLARRFIPYWQAFMILEGTLHVNHQYHPTINPTTYDSDLPTRYTGIIVVQLLKE